MTTQMDLILWRHAEAIDRLEHDSPREDLKRPLTPRGEKQAARMAAWIRQHAPEHLRILASPAVRTQQTAQALGLPFETVRQIGPEARVADLLAAANWPDGGDDPERKPERPAVLIIGHQPTLGQLAALLLAGQEQDWAVKKGAIWWLSTRTRRSTHQTVLRAAITAEML